MKIYRGLDWGVLADHLPNPGFYLSIRGGKAGWEVPHSHQDLGTFQCVVGDERLIDNPGANGGSEYLDSTFSNRRYDLFETTPASKNVVLLNGVGINNPASSQTTSLSGPGWKAFCVDITGSLWWIDPSTVIFCARLFLFIGRNPSALIIDHIQLKNAGRMEARFHSFSKVSSQEMNALIRGRRSSLSMAFASDVPASLHRTGAALTTPDQSCSVLRLCTNERIHRQATLATLLVPGKTETDLVVKNNGNQIVAEVKIGKNRRTFKIARNLLKISAS